ncbi:MAG: FAD-binding protein [Spirochaetaceae bacterium]|jgi:succinate dehydrogenase/fumarate reductase flavoprotein subunit|nr:FAD-binding protein [Spirochaetaceae bacterium]
MTKKFRAWMLLPLVLALAAACASGAASGSAGRAAGGDFPATVSWDAEYDVVVVGFGGAGAATAVTAADNGAKVLLLEKAPLGEEGGNTRYAAQLVMMPKKGQRENAITYYKAMRGEYGNQTDEMIEFIVDGALGHWDWFEKMGVSASRLGIFPLIEYPELPGGNEAIQTTFMDGVIWQAQFWKFLRGLVFDRRNNIDVWYETPGVRLIQDPASKIIHGVVVEHGGRTYNVRAINGVVLTTGGFENNDAMLENYAQLYDAYSKAARYNTGDGITMALEVGADLWHMSTLAGPDVNFINPQSGIAQNYYFASASKTLNFTGFAAGPVIIVGGNGRRFTNETEAPRHGHVEVGGTWFSLLVPRNSWCVFDETARLAAPAYPTWSQGMEEEIAKGWIVRANTISELAQKTGIDPAGLQAEITKYNGYCRTGVDLEYDTDPRYLKPLAAQGPYYAFPVKASLTNTQGGPRRNTNCEVLDPRGKPIPHLYSAGELGSFYTDIYNGGGNLSECLFAGRTAGANAARTKSDVSSARLLSSNKIDFRSDTLEEFIAKAAAAAGPNEYIGAGSGMGTDLVLKVTYANSRITNITFLMVHETVGVSDKAITGIPRAIIAANNTSVDTVTGATVTSRAIIQAVNDALSKAR